MKHKLVIASLALATSFSFSTPVRASDVLTGETRLACEALLCLASGTRPSECAPSLSKYFSISYKKFTDTLKGRINFLNLCPVSNQSYEMSSLVSAMVNGAGRCDAQSLNSTLLTRSWNEDGYIYISNQFPSYCTAYTGHQYTSLGDTVPKYVGTPERGGHWVEGKDYAGAVAYYNNWIAQEDARKAQEAAQYWNQQGQ